jgi:hypothetical protein
MPSPPNDSFHLMVSHYGDNMSKQAKLLNYLSTGASVTARQISGSFGLKNPHGTIHELRSQGHCIYANKSKLADGTETTKYRIGRPTKRMVALANAVAGAQVFTRS